MSGCPEIVGPSQPLPRSPGKVQFHPAHWRGNGTLVQAPSDQEGVDALELSVRSTPDTEKPPRPHSPITLLELMPHNPDTGGGANILEQSEQDSRKLPNGGPQRTVPNVVTEIGFSAQFSKFMQRHKLNGMSPGDRVRSLSLSSEAETRTMLIELVDICQTFAQRSQSNSDSDSHREVSSAKSLNMSMSSFLHGLGPRLHAVQSDFNLPAPAYTDHLEEGEDDAGFSTLNEYTILGEAGCGSYGRVHIATTPSGEYRAIKAVKKSILKKQWRNMRRRTVVDGLAAEEDQLCDSNSLFSAAVNKELEIMKKVRHQNIVHLCEAIDDPDESVLYLVMPFVERGPLVKLTKEGSCEPLDIDVCRGYLRQIIDALRYLHERNIVHCDIKPDNILLGSNGRVYLSDFGVSKMFDDGECSTTDQLLGTPSFMAPECFPNAARAHQAHAPTRVNGKLVDVWALGVTLYTLLLGHLPFTGSSQEELIDAIQHREPEYIPLSVFSKDSREDYAAAFDLVKRMLTKDPEARITVKRCARHQFLRRSATSDGDCTAGSFSASVEQR